MSDGQVAPWQIPWKEVNRSRATDMEHAANIVLGDPDHGLAVTEIAQLLNLQPSSVRIYLRSDKRRIDLYRRLFEENEATKERAHQLLEARRAGQA